MVRLGSTYKQKYFGGVSHEVTEIEKGLYQINNKPNAPLFAARLRLNENGTAILKVNYTSYSGVKNRYFTYFDELGREIIGNSDSEEKRYYNKLDMMQ